MQSVIFFLKKFLYYFDKITSQNATNWLLALIWVFIFEFISTILEYYYLNISHTYVYHIPNGILKELFIALLVITFILIFVYTIIFMKKILIFFLILYVLIGIYILITRDITFNLLFHNIINPFEFKYSSIFYISLQVLIKIISIYLIYITYLSIVNKKR